ncbi:MAG TPA: hypothetical protein PLD20_04295 [Blastocatellia bacterium]|nr:hypothetical protein [Blastocatellia bacterium]HMX27640.1 hypothetical protein [Blastocatellia bacterium]HMZ17126.1 hypothetical protein [Blastocatellia bacterium]HNG32624.1 hypothetical protein [Blastocatellia bacterium]
MIPDFDQSGNLPSGIHWADWLEFEKRFGTNPRRKVLLAGLKRATTVLRKAGCQTIFVDGSFVTAKALPGDFDACWSVEGVDPDLLDPVLLDFSNGRAAQKAKYGGEMFPAELIEGASGKPFLDFFQIDKNTGKLKGIVGLRLKAPPTRK